MTKTEIHPPDYNDSFSRVALDGVLYAIRFTWNDTAKRWTFGLYTSQQEPIIVGIRIVPNFPLNIHLVDDRIPNGIFIAMTTLEHIGRYDFLNGKASLSYISFEE